MDRYVEVVKQYPGQQQVDVAVEIEDPGSWFGVGPMGSQPLTPPERRKKYTAQAVEYSDVRELPGASRVVPKPSASSAARTQQTRRIQRVIG